MADLNRENLKQAIEDMRHEKADLVQRSAHRLLANPDLGSDFAGMDVVAVPSCIFCSGYEVDGIIQHKPDCPIAVLRVELGVDVAESS
jgi:hypothetical protein